MKISVALIGVGIIGLGTSIIFGERALVVTAVVQAAIFVVAVFRWTR